MRLSAKGVLLLLLLYVTAARVALAQEKGANSNGVYRVTREIPALQQQKPIGFRPLTLSEGLTILGVALDSRHRHADFSADCSHFVHGLYERAGFPYEYASSSDLYAGIDEFRRVASPQPGDLAVWRGHAGIVVNPVQHSFFSVLHSGPGIDSYDAPYWKQRGQPRFFRYIKPAPQRSLSTPIRTASWKPTVLGKTNPRETPADVPGPDTSEDSSNDLAFSATLAEDHPVHGELSHVAVVSYARPKPHQVSTAFLQACNDSEEMLRGRDLFKSAQPLLVFDHFEVDKVHITGNQGWVEVKIDELASLVAGQTELHKRSQRQRWSLRRRDDNKSWKLTPSRNAIYLPQHTAERILAHELAQLTEDTPDNTSRTQEKAELARLLGVLFEE
jgi:uncharacterized membrane protein